MSDDDQPTVPPDPATTGDGYTEPARKPGSGRGWKIAAAVAVLAALTSIGVLGALLFGGAGGSDEPAGDVRACIVDPASRDFTRSKDDEPEHDRPSDCPPKGARQIDGLVRETSAGGFTMREILDGQQLGETVELHVREPDRPYIDIAHAGTHAALGQPIRVYVLDIDGRESVVYMEDAPLLG